MATPFLHNDFLLTTETARELYHGHAAAMPIFDYHCHLPAQEIASDRVFDNLAQVWLHGDHYKWRAMRSNGIDERYCTGDAPDTEKLTKWAETMIAAPRNPLYIWTHLELARYFGITDRQLNPKTAHSILGACNEQLRTPEFSVRNLLRRMHVKTVCTTNDPTSALTDHRTIRESGLDIAVLPTFRPDKAMAPENPITYNRYLDELATVSDTEIRSFATLIQALDKRHEFFATMGCRASDHGLETIYAECVTDADAGVLFDRVRTGHPLDVCGIGRLKSAIMLHLARMDARRGWVMQLHVGVMRNNNSRLFASLGPDIGCDAMGDFTYAQPLARFFDMLTAEGALPKTMLFNANPRDNELLVSIMGAFQDGSMPGKMQHGPGWWFLDQKDGMERQINALSSLGLLGRFVGMTTDSRSFLSFPRHEYFRRILCNLLGRDVENGELPDDMDLLGSLVRDVCYDNAVRYFA